MFVIVLDIFMPLHLLLEFLLLVLISAVTVIVFIVCRRIGTIGVLVKDFTAARDRALATFLTRIIVIIVLVLSCRLFSSARL